MQISKKQQLQTTNLWIWQTAVRTKSRRQNIKYRTSKTYQFLLFFHRINTFDTVLLENVFVTLQEC